MRTALLAVILLTAPCVAASQDTDLFVQRCRAGDLPACNVAGLVFQTGSGEDEDLARAMDLYRLACSGGDATGCTSIGLMYANGRGVERDRGTAAEQYRLACDQNDRFACDLFDAINAEGPITERRPFFKQGRVLDADSGEGLSDVLVDVPELGLQLLSDEAGRVELGRIPEGTYRLGAELLGYEPVNGVLNVPGYAEFVLLLERIPSLERDQLGQVVGIVANPRRRGLPGVTVEIVRPEGGSTTTNPEGRFALPAGRPGLWTVRFTATGGSTVETQVVVQPGRAARVDATVSDEGIRISRGY